MNIIKIGLQGSDRVFAYRGHGASGDWAAAAAWIHRHPGAE